MSQHCPQQKQLQQSLSEKELEFADIWRALVMGKWVMLSCTLLCLAVAVVYASSLPSMYRSTAVVVPAMSSGSNSFSGIKGQLGGLASIAGINLGSGSSGNRTAEAIHVLESWDFIESFISEKGIAPEVFAVTGWDSSRNKLIYDRDRYNPNTGDWISFESDGSMPSSWALYSVFKSFLSVREDSKSGFVYVSIDYFSPQMAQQWVAGLVSKLNRMLKQQAIKDAQQNIDFLIQQAERTKLSSMQSVFYDLIEEQTKTLMLASSDKEFVFRILSAPRVAEERASPNRLLICVMGGFLGLVVGIVLGAIYGLVKKT